MNHPKISIIVPVYNVEKYLKECVESVLAQTFTDCEHFTDCRNLFFVKNKILL